MKEESGTGSLRSRSAASKPSGVTIGDHLEAKHGLRAQLLALADRCEREEPSRGLDHSIMWSLRPNMTDEEPAPSYTASLDAAVTLVPEGWNRSVEYFAFDAVMPYREPGAKASVWRDSRNPRERFFNISAKTEALALCAAALRARAAVAEDAGPPSANGASTNQGEP